MANFKLAVLTPRGLIFDGDVSSMVARGSEGQLGVLAGHAPMIVSTIPGVLKISAGTAKTDPDTLRGLAGLGVSRIGVGPPAFDPEGLRKGLGELVEAAAKV